MLAPKPMSPGLSALSGPLILRRSECRWSPLYVRAVVALVVNDAYLASLTTVLLALGVWRFYTFTILPWLYPTDPEEYPYWVPFIGESFGLFL